MAPDSRLGHPRPMQSPDRRTGARGWWRGLGLLLLACACSATAFAQAGAEPAQGLKSKNVSERLAAIEALRTSADPKDEKLLLGVLNDRDWEVAERAALALAERGGDASVGPLVRMCVDAPIVRQRRAAARTLAKVAPVEGSKELVKLTAGKLVLRALEALAIVAGPNADAAVGSAVQRGLKSKDRLVRRAAAASLGSLEAATADQLLGDALAGSDLEVCAAMLDAVALSARPHFLPVLLKALHATALPDVLERRLIAAARACMQTLEKLGRPEQPSRELEQFSALGPLSGAPAEARATRLYAALASVAIADSPLSKALLQRLMAALASPHPSVRKAALAGVLRNKLPGAAESALSVLAKDADGSVRSLALIELLSCLGPADPALFAALTERLASDSDPDVREQAAVALGVPELPGAVEALVRGIGDPQWPVFSCAAVSLGKTRDPAALAPLASLRSHADWRARASAAVGLCWLARVEALPELIRALGDSDASVRRIAHEYLEQNLHAKLPAEPAAWEAWWKENGERVKLVDPVEEKKRRERYGYAPKPEGVFEDLDVFVLQSRGDHIERLLEHLKIAHEMTQASKLEELGIHPGSIYVSNCTGEIETKDVERLAWYVRAGGYLFGSCWSLAETIERIHPGVLRKLPTNGEVMGDVVACAVDPQSPYLKGVFGPDLEPLYHLEGSHLIEVLEPERCHVLIDSPQALQTWGGGNLAATFRSGHGLILDSANHFDLQGLEVAPGLRTAADRIAFAFDRMGLDYETWRRTHGEKWWDSALKASQNVFDFSALQFVTNFVRSKRLSDG